MSLEKKRTNEFRRYRQALTAVYLGTAVAGLALLSVSIIKELFFRRPAVELPRSALSMKDPAPGELLDCHRRVLDLFLQMGSKTCELLALPPSGDRSELPARWEDFSRAWRDEWDVVDARCRFSELADTNMGVAYDRLAQVHGNLPTMRLKYQSLLVRFDDEQAAELARMRRALDLSRAALEEEVKPGHSAEPTPRTAPAPAGP